MTDDDLDVKEETTEDEQISELKEELQKLQEQIRELSLRPKGMMTWERVLLYILLAANLPGAFYTLLAFYHMI